MVLRVVVACCVLAVEDVGIAVVRVAALGCGLAGGEDGSGEGG